MAVHYCKFNYIMIPIMAAILDVVLLLEQIKTEPLIQDHSLRGICHVAGRFIMLHYFHYGKIRTLFSME